MNIDWQTRLGLCSPVPLNSTPSQEVDPEDMGGILLSVCCTSSPWKTSIVQTWCQSLSPDLRHSIQKHYVVDRYLSRSYNQKMMICTDCETMSKCKSKGKNKVQKSFFKIIIQKFAKGTQRFFGCLPLQDTTIKLGTTQRRLQIISQLTDETKWVPTRDKAPPTAQYKKKTVLAVVLYSTNHRTNFKAIALKQENRRVAEYRVLYCQISKSPQIRYWGWLLSPSLLACCQKITTQKQPD